jgi:hypothetical protein
VKRYLFSAKGAVSLPAWGNAPGLVKSPSASAGSAIYFGTVALNRAFSAYRRSLQIPGALPQATSDIAPLAPNRCVQIEPATHTLSHNAIYEMNSNHAS